jgi:3-hydroxyisobutyrate dehydrogenase
MNQWNCLFVGLGNLGSVLSNQIAKSRNQVMIYDINTQVTEKVEKEYLNLRAVDLTEGLEQADVVLTCLPNSRDVQEVIAEAIRYPGKLKNIRYWIDTTSGSPKVSRALAAELEAHGVDYLDCAVSGGPAGATSGSLTAMIGGKEEAFTSVKDLIQSFAKNLVHLGPVGSGHAVKAVNNTLLAANILSVAEAMIALKSFDVPLERALSAINTSSGRSWVSQQRFPDHVLPRTFDYGFSFGLHCKDVSTFDEMRNDHKLEASILSNTLRVLQGAKMHLSADADHLEVIKVLEEKSGIKIE